MTICVDLYVLHMFVIIDIHFDNPSHWLVPGADGYMVKSIKEIHSLPLLLKIDT